MFAPGDVLGARYTLRRTDWSSPLGPVWSARDQVLDRSVFVQVLSAGLGDDRAVKRAFQKAAARTAQVSHAGLLQVFDIGDDPAFVVFEHAAGGRLTERLRSGPLRPEDAARAALGIARGLEALHDHGAFHGSLSPASAFFDEEGRAKILVTGVAEIARAMPGLALPSEQTPGYRPRELDVLPADADRYALAALLFHMLHGKAPERGTPSARAPRRGVAADLDGLLSRALSDTPAYRPSLDEFVGALAPYARVVPTDARQPRMRVGELRWLVPLFVILALAAGAVYVGTTVDFRQHDPKPRPTASSTPVPNTPVPVVAVHDFDPGGNGEENPNRTGRTIDGDPLTTWKTLDYARAALDGQKKGVGLVFDLGTVRNVGRVRVQTTTPGWTAEIRIARVDGATQNDFRLVTSFVAGQDTPVNLPHGTRARYVLVWITALVDDGGGSDLPFTADVAEVEFFTT